MSRSAEEVHADILRMAKTKAQRETIKWFHARRVCFDLGGLSSFVAGLSLAQHIQHEDACLLVSLFPEAPRTLEEAAAVFEKARGQTAVFLGLAVWRECSKKEASLQARCRGRLRMGTAHLCDSALRCSVCCVAGESHGEWRAPGNDFSSVQTVARHGRCGG